MIGIISVFQVSMPSFLSSSHIYARQMICPRVSLDITAIKILHNIKRLCSIPAYKNNKERVCGSVRVSVATFVYKCIQQWTANDGCVHHKSRTDHSRDYVTVCVGPAAIALLICQLSSATGAPRSDNTESKNTITVLLSI